MIDSEKHEFIAVMTTTADVYGKEIKNERIAIYWSALKHRDMADVKSALNRHIQDAERGRFFPLPADIAAQLPQEASAWLTADEAWAACPKDEGVSAAMCDEIAASLGIAKDLIDMGDMIAARRAFIDHYNRLTDEAKRESRKPKWWASLGHDKDGRHKAKVEIVERNNLMLPPSERLALPEPDNDSAISMKQLISSIPKSNITEEDKSNYLSEMKEKLGMNTNE